MQYHGKMLVFVVIALALGGCQTAGPAPAEAQVETIEPVRPTPPFCPGLITYIPLEQGAMFREAELIVHGRVVSVDGPYANSDDPDEVVRPGQDPDYITRYWEVYWLAIEPITTLVNETDLTGDVFDIYMPAYCGNPVLQAGDTVVLFAGTQRFAWLSAEDGTKEIIATFGENYSYYLLADDGYYYQPMLGWPYTLPDLLAKIEEERAETWP